MTPSAAPRLSVLVPTFGRPERIATLLGLLDAQTLDPGAFEVVVVDDGSPAPLALDPGAHAFALTALRQDNAGPAAARNRGLERCRAPLTLILNDDALPAPDLLQTHLSIRAEVDDATAVLGAFPFSARAVRSPFVQLLAGTDLLFQEQSLRPGELHDWPFFWTCNLSLPTAALRAAGGFDAERFREAIVEDVELGYRLAQRGLRVLHRPEARCEHDHVITPQAYFRRMQRLGVNLARMYAKHGDPAILWSYSSTEVDERYLHGIQGHCERNHEAARKLLAMLERVEAGGPGALAGVDLAPPRALLARLGLVPFYRGVLLELTGHDPGTVLDEGPPPDELTSIVVLSHDALDTTRRCLQALRAAREPRHPTEILFVDNGSRDGSAEFLAAQPDVELIRNAANVGAPRARNQALARARGRWIVFMDNDAIVPPGWLGRLLHHAAVDPTTGCVGPVSDRCAHHQQIEVPPWLDLSDPAALAELSERNHADQRRLCRFSRMLSSFCILVRREVIERIGGFDERFSPWGFEDDDFTARCTLAGFRNRIALDVFVRHEAYAHQDADQNRALLRRNWQRFAAKWGLAGDTEYGDQSAMIPVFESAHEPAELLVPVAS